MPTGREAIIRAAFSTTSLPKILGNTAHLSMLRGYDQFPATWRRWCSTGSVNDFKLHTRARLTVAGNLVLLNNNGEVESSSVTEEYEQLSVSTYARNVGFTRQNIINDDLGFLTRQRMRDGNAAARKISQLVYAHLLANGNMHDSIALFHASHSNLLTSSALTSATLAAAITSFRNQTDKAGEAINVEPAFMLVSPTLEYTAKTLLESDMLIGRGDDELPSGNKNVHQGIVLPIIEPRLSNTNYTGYSTTTWYLTGSPAAVDTLEVAFLNGMQNPTMNTFANPTPDVLGITFQVYQDVGVKALDWRGMTKATA